MALSRKECVLRTFHNEPADRILTAFWHHYLDNEHADGFHEPEYIRKNLEGARKFKEEMDPDFVKVMTDGFFFPPFHFDEIHCASDLVQLRPTDEMDAFIEKNAAFAKELRNIYGDDLLCCGTKEEIQAYAEQIVREAGSTGVIIGADCTTHLDTPLEHLLWVKEVAEKLSAQLPIAPASHV